MLRHRFRHTRDYLTPGIGRLIKPKRMEKCHFPNSHVIMRCIALHACMCPKRVDRLFL